MKNVKWSAGFTLIEVLISVAIMGILLSFAVLNFTSVQHKTTLTSTVDTLIADLSGQQIKAMSEDTEGRGVTDTYGIHFNTTSYTLFHGTYSANDSSNFIINLPTSQQITTPLGREFIFAPGSGEFVGFSQPASSVTLQDTVSGEQRTIQLNRFGVITGVN